MMMLPLESAWRVRQAIDDLLRAAERAGVPGVVCDLNKMQDSAANFLALLEDMPRKILEATTADDVRRLRHDLRTPVNQIIGYCELIDEDTEDAGDRRWASALQAILAGGRDLLHHVDLLDFRLRDGGVEVFEGPKAPLPNETTGRLRAIDPSLYTSDTLGTVLVVDDDRSNRELLERRLRRDGFEVITADHGVRALEIIKVQSVDVILLDIMMPVMDGYETLDRLKGDPEFRHLPVIMLTSLDEAQSVTHCIERGAEDHLPRPFDPVLLRARIGSSLEKKKIRDLEHDYLQRIVAEKRRADDLLHGVIPIGVALSAERDFNRLLERLLERARQFCGADGGVILLRRDDRLVYVKLQCSSLKLNQGGGDQTIDMPAVELGQSGSVPIAAAKAAQENATVNLHHIRNELGIDLSLVQAFDQRYDYITSSLIALPLRSVDGEIVGVLELWNATRAASQEIVPFDQGMVDVLESLSRLAGVALDSYRREHELRKRIRHLEIRVDEVNRRREVSQITETDYFRRLREMAQKIRSSAVAEIGS